MITGTIRPGTFTAAGALVAVQGGPWRLGQPPIVRLAHAGQLAAVRDTKRWTGSTWASVRPS